MSYEEKQKFRNIPYCNSVLLPINSTSLYPTENENIPKKVLSFIV